MAVAPEDLRATLRKFASGITVVTVAYEGHVHGMTASSFSSVSLEPPLVLVCLAQKSRTRSLVAQAGRFAVNILAAHQSETARLFAREGAKTFDNVPHLSGAHGAPLINGALAALECRTVQTHEAGDHDVVVAAVEACRFEEGTPLVYFEGAYRELLLLTDNSSRDPRSA